MSNNEMKLMNLNQEHLVIQSDYSSVWYEIHLCVRMVYEFMFGNRKLTQTTNVDKEEESITIEIQKPVTLPVAVKYASL